MSKRHTSSTGFTLIELLLYVSVVGVLTTGVVAFLGRSLEARVKNQSISEVNQQGDYIMELITQTIRNASSITSPAASASGSALTLAVSNASLSPTVFNIDTGASQVLGNNGTGTATDTSDSGSINATKFIATASGNVSVLHARVGSTIGASPNNKAQMALYSGATPTTLLAVSGDTTLTADSWINFSIPTVAITSGTTYWLAYNTNGTTSAENNLRRASGAAGASMFTAQTYGTWNPSWTGTGQAVEFSMYADVVTGTGSGALQITEGTGAAVPLSNSKVQVSDLTFTNLSRPGTPGLIQVSFTLSRVNPANKSSFEYQKTFVSSAALRWP